MSVRVVDVPANCGLKVGDEPLGVCRVRLDGYDVGSDLRNVGAYLVEAMLCVVLELGNAGGQRLNGGEDVSVTRLGHGFSVRVPVGLATGSR
jgi:hypothetical protein